MNNLDKLEPWQPATGDILTIIISSRPNSCCLACAEASVSWNPAACLASVYCVHAGRGWHLVVFANTRVLAGEWQPFEGTVTDFLDWQVARSFEAQQTATKLRAAGGEFWLSLPDDPDQPTDIQ